MSNRPKPRRISAFPKAGADEGYVSVPALIPDRHKDGVVEHARQATHDALHQSYAVHMKSGVWWTEYVGAEAARMYKRLCEEFDAEPDPEGEEVLRDNPRGMLVVAWAIASQTAAAVPSRKFGWI